MITGFILQIFIAFVNAVLSVLPVVALPTGWISAILLIWGYVNALNFLFPVSTLLDVLLIGLSFQVIIMLLRFTIWIIGVVRGR